MSHARLTHPSRPTLEFRTGQQSESQRQAQANVINGVATDRPPLVHTETREVTESERGSVTGLRRAENDPDTSDPYQALANYALELEAHVDEFQGAGGDGYTYVNDQSGAAKDCVLESVEWSLTPGQRYELDYQATVQIGRAVYQARPIDPESVVAGAPFEAMLRLDGVELPNMRDYRVATSVGLNPRPVFDRDSAENNDIMADGGRQRRVTFEGVATGTRSDRQAFDSAVEQRLATRDPITLETRFPGYEIDGYLIAHSPTWEQQRSFGDARDGANRYSITFIEGTRA